jgi:multisubunit Na+/H+ antiporter MnhC subunit
MKNIFKELEVKLNHLVWALVFYGVVFMTLAVFVTFSEYLLKVMVGLSLLLIAYTLFYFAYKLWSIKKIVSK